VYVIRITACLHPHSHTHTCHHFRLLQPQAGNWERFTITPHPQGGNRVAIQSSHGTFLRAHAGGEGARVDLQTKVGEMDIWICVGARVLIPFSPLPHPPCHPTQPGEWEAFEIVASHGGFPGHQAQHVNIRSVAHGTFLRAHAGGEGARVDMMVHPGHWEAFLLVSLSVCLSVCLCDVSRARVNMHANRTLRRSP
jgi:hypothetical protein